MVASQPSIGYGLIKRLFTGVLTQSSGLGQTTHALAPRIGRVMSADLIRPLDGFVVLDFSQFLAGPVAAM
jgi:hypothetical protein